VSPATIIMLWRHVIVCWFDCLYFKRIWVNCSFPLAEQQWNWLQWFIYSSKYSFNLIFSKHFFLTFLYLFFQCD
jgi:hypothetical protein